MSTVDFPGAQTLIAAIDSAVAGRDGKALGEALRRALCGLMHEQCVRLPDCVFTPKPDHYARRELYQSARHGYCVIAMTWGPGQGTPVHDHAGHWCVEGIWSGELEITPYELLESYGDRFRFEPRGTLAAGTGSAGSLIPPHDYHVIHNPSREHAAVSVHVYGAPMTECSVFNPGADGWYTREVRHLSLDALH